MDPHTLSSVTRPYPHLAVCRFVFPPPSLYIYRASLKPEAYVRRDGVAVTINAADIVPGDVILLTAGNTVAADCQIIEGEDESGNFNKPVSIDQAALTGESLPVTLRPGDSAMMGSQVVNGEVDALVTATGAQTFFGRTASMISSVDEMGHFQKVVLQITFGLMSISFVLCGICLVYLLFKHNDVLDSLAFCVVLLVASIPIAMQVVCTTTMALGCKKLADEKAIVTRLTSIEQLASMTMLCSDKTGTLTMNKMELQDDVTSYVDGLGSKDVLMYAGLAAKWKEPAKDAIDTLVINAIDKEYLSAHYELVDYLPFDASIKRTESTVKLTGRGGAPDVANTMTVFKVTKGAPQVILSMCANYDEVHEEAESKITNLASRGIRCLAVARTGMKTTSASRLAADAAAGFSGDDALAKWEFVGLITFLDPPRPDTKETIERAHSYGVAVKMITGDQVAIAKEMCRIIGLDTHILLADSLPHDSASVAAHSKTLAADYGDVVQSCDGFAQVYPEHKFFIVETFRQLGYVTGMTGDGVNDAPALKRADIGIAVEGATDAAQAASDLVLTQPGLSTIISAIIVSRAIFQRMKNYVIYRIACTIELLFFFFIAVLFLHPDHFNSDADFQAHNYFKLPVVALVVITILNDGCIISIAYDIVEPPTDPENWFLTELFLVASVLGAVAVASSIWLLILAIENDHSHLWTHFKLQKMTYGQVMMIIYLKVSISDFLTVFSARTRSFFFTRRPGTPLLVAAVVALGVSTLLGRYWFLENGLEQIDWRTIGILWAYCFVWFLIQDIVKVLFYKFLDFCYRMQAKRASRTKSMPPSSSGLPIAEKPFDAADALVKIARMEENIALLRREVLVHAAKQAEQSGG